MNKKILLAKIVSAHGIKGEVKILYFGDNPKNLEKYHLFDSENKPFRLKLVSKNIINKSTNKLVIARIEGVADRNQAESLKNLELFVDREEFAKTKKDEFYIIDLIGLEVLNISKQKIGTVINVYDFASVPNVEIEFLAEFIPLGFQKINNFPFKNDFFPEIKIAENYLIFDAPELV